MCTNNTVGPVVRVDPLSRSELVVAETFQLPPSFLEGVYAPITSVMSVDCVTVC